MGASPAPRALPDVVQLSHGAENSTEFPNNRPATPLLGDRFPPSEPLISQTLRDRFHESTALMYRLPLKKHKETVLSDAAYRLATGARVSAREICDPSSYFGQYIRAALTDLAEQSQLPHEDADILEYFKDFKMRIIADLILHGQLVENYLQAPAMAVEPTPPPVPTPRPPTTWSAAVSASSGPVPPASPAVASTQARPEPAPAPPAPTAPKRPLRRPKPTYVVKGLQAVLALVAPTTPLVQQPFTQMDPATLRLPVLKALRLFGFKQADLRFATTVEVHADDMLLIRFPDASKAFKAFRNKKVYLGATYSQLSINPWYPPRRQARAATAEEIRQGLADLRVAMEEQTDADDWDLPSPPPPPSAQQAPAPQGPATSSASASDPPEQPEATINATAMEGVVSPNSKRALGTPTEGAPSVSPPKKRQGRSTGSAEADEEMDAVQVALQSASRSPSPTQADCAGSRPALRK